MYLIDTHTHLFDEAFSADMHDTVVRAIDAGVTKMVLPCCSERSLPGIADLCDSFPGNCFPTLGVHPEDIGPDHEAQLKAVFAAKFSSPIVAVGEIGIDLHYMTETLDVQKVVFDTQVRMAIDMDLPIIIHCREAYDEVFSVLEKYRGKVRGIFHCFSGGESDARRVLDFGSFYFGIGGVITFKKSGQETAQCVKDIIPMEKIVLETDSPYLAPVPYRGKRNDSSYVPLIAHKVAELKGITYDEVVGTTTKNAERIFGI